MKIFLCLFCSMICFQNQAQVKFIDSLQHVLENHTTEDTVKVNLLIQMVNAQAYRDTRVAMDFAQKALYTAKKIKKWDKGLARVYKISGAIDYISGDYARAVAHWQQALMYAEKINDDILAASLYGNIGVVQNELGERDKALESYFKKLEIIKPYKIETEEALTLGNLSAIYIQLENYDTALYYNDNALKIAETLQDNNLLANLYTIRAASYKQQKDYRSALEYYELALAHAEVIDQTSLKSAIFNQMALSYALSEDFKKAEELNEMAITLAKKSGSKKWEYEAYQNKALIYEEKGDFKNALLNYVSYIELRDSVIGEEKKVENARMEVQFESDKKQALAEAEIYYQKNIQKGVLAVSALLLLAGAFVFRSSKKRQEVLHQQKETLYKAYVSETELKVRRLQMNPHFIFNSLNSIGDYISKNDIIKADYYLSKFAGLMRGTMENSEENEITLSEELRILELYMQLESMRTNNKFDYHICVAEDINPNTTLVPPMILQPFVENSIWHGLAEKNKGTIAINISKINGLLTCTVEDNGAGWTNKQPTFRKKSYGIKITQERLNIIGKIKHVDSGLKITNLGKGTRVEITLPFEEV